MSSYPSWKLNDGVRVNCMDCTAECCKHVAIQIDAPASKEDFEAIASYLRHENVSVYKDNEGDWLVEFKTRCRQLDGNRCKAFKTNSQPMTCREYSIGNCVMNSPGEYYKTFLWTPKEAKEQAAKEGIKISISPKNLCDDECCNHVHIPLDEPENWRDFDDIRWYIAHENVSVYQDGSGWFVELLTPLRERCKRCDNEACRYDNPERISHFDTWLSVEEHIKRKGLSPSAKEKMKLSSY